MILLEAASESQGIFGLIANNRTVDVFLVLALLSLTFIFFRLRKPKEEKPAGKTTTEKKPGEHDDKGDHKDKNTGEKGDDKDKEDSDGSAPADPHEKGKGSGKSEHDKDEHAHPPEPPLWKKGLYYTYRAAVVIAGLCLCAYFFPISCSKGKIVGDEMEQAVRPYAHQSTAVVIVPKKTTHVYIPTDTTINLSKIGSYVVNLDDSDSHFHAEVISKRDSICVDGIWYQDSPKSHIVLTGAQHIEFRACKGVPAKLHYTKDRIKPD